MTFPTTPPGSLPVREHPNPGSPEAVAQGCTCPVIDNHYGRGMPYLAGPRFWIKGGCPLHAGASASVRGRPHDCERIIDPTRQGIASHEPEPGSSCGQHPPVSLEDAIAVVDSWDEGFGPFRLHQVAGALRREIARLQDEAEITEAECCAPSETDGLRDHVRSLQEQRALLVDDRDVWLRRACTAVATTNRVNEETAARLGTLRRENDELRRRIGELEDDAAAAANDLGWAQSVERSFRALCDAIGIERGTTDWPEWIAAVRAEIAGLRYRATQAGMLMKRPDGYASPQDVYSLPRAIDLMDAWRPEVERWGLHQMCRVLRQEYEGAVAAVDDGVARLSRAVLMYDAAEQRALAAIPCARVKDDCPGHDYPYAPCCNLRVALMPGEPFPTDYLKDDGMIHLFEPADPACPRAPRKSAGCVKLVGFDA